MFNLKSFATLSLKISATLGLFLFLSASPTKASSVNYNFSVINDHLVENLSCHNLNKDTLLKSLRSDFDSIAKQIPQRNWSFRTGVYNLGACWSLSRTQRMIYYLSGFDVRPEDALKPNLDMIKRWLPVWNNLGYVTYKDKPSFSLMPDFQSFYSDLVRGYDQNVGSQKVKRNFKADIETYQTHRFHQFLKNKDYIKGRRERPVKDNRISFQTLIKNLDSRRLTLINLRPSLNSQHVVLVKNYVKLNDKEILFKVYDSNHPTIENDVFYNLKTEHFYAPSIVRDFMIERPEDPIGLFVVDEDERERALDFLVTHYKKTCATNNEL